MGNPHPRLCFYLSEDRNGDGDDFGRGIGTIKHPPASSCPTAIPKKEEWILFVAFMQPLAWLRSFPTHSSILDLYQKVRKHISRPQKKYKNEYYPILKKYHHTLYYNA